MSKTITLTFKSEEDRYDWEYATSQGNLYSWTQPTPTSVTISDQDQNWNTEGDAEQAAEKLADLEENWADLYYLSQHADEDEFMDGQTWVQWLGITHISATVDGQTTEFAHAA